MTRRQQVGSSSRLGRLRDRIRSTFTAGTSDATAVADDRATAAHRESARESGDATGNLFQCPTCSVVFIAEEKQQCSECENEVEQVRSTLSCQ